MNRIYPGTRMPELDVALVGGGTAHIGGKGNWQVVVVYRGKHCPMCKSYLIRLESLKPEFAKVGARLLAVSADTKEKADSDVADLRLTFPVGFGLSMDQMKAMGLYISEPLGLQETNANFAEPGMYVINPDGLLHLVCVSNSASARPDMAVIASGIARTQELQRPIRGTLAY